MKSTAQIAFDDGLLTAVCAGVSRRFARPAELAVARFACVSPPASLSLDSGADLLTAAFTVLPFIAPPLPIVSFGPDVTPAAREAFGLLAGADAAASGTLTVLRGEPGVFIVFARRTADGWKAGALVSDALTLTVRFEDLWNRLPSQDRAFTYRAEIVRDPHEKDPDEVRTAGVVHTVCTDLAPDVRLCLDLAANGGFTLTFIPTKKTRS